jgi:hypothetical protein
LLDVLGKCVYDRTVIAALVCLEEPAVDKFLDLAEVQFNYVAAIPSPPSRPASSHAVCRTHSGGFGGYVYRDSRLLNQTDR